MSDWEKYTYEYDGFDNDSVLASVNVRIEIPVSFISEKDCNDYDYQIGFDRLDYSKPIDTDNPQFKKINDFEMVIYEVFGDDCFDNKYWFETSRDGKSILFDASYYTSVDVDVTSQRATWDEPGWSEDTFDDESVKLENDFRNLLRYMMDKHNLEGEFTISIERVN